VIAPGAASARSPIAPPSPSAFVRELDPLAAPLPDAPTFVVIGAGGLGCPALLGLWAAGAREVIVVDPDRVELSNLPRQVLFHGGHLDAPKAACAAATLGPRGRAGQRIQWAAARVDAAWLARVLPRLAPGSVLVECSDAPSLKFAVNAAARAHAIPAAIGAALGWRGQVCAVGPHGACYRCIHEAPPPPELLPTCASAGVLGPAVGTVGALLAATASALAPAAARIAGDTGDPAGGSLIDLDLRRGVVRTLTPSPRPGCPDCAAAPPAPP